MRRAPSIEPFTPSPNVQLHPTLQAVLDSLDVQIDEELSRYRRQRRQPSARPRRQARLQDPTALGILKQNIQLPTPRSSLYENQSSHYSTQPKTARPSQLSQPSSSYLPSQSAIEPFAEPSVVRPAAQPPEPQSLEPHSLESQLLESQSLEPRSRVARDLTPPAWSSALQSAQDTAAPDLPASEPAIDKVDSAASARIDSYANQYDLSAYAPNSTLQRLLHQAGMPASGMTALGVQGSQDRGQNGFEEAQNYEAQYLASSEELLRSIAEESREQTADREPNSMLDTLLTPLGVGSMLLLLLTSTTLGYVVMNPTSVGLSPGISIGGTSNQPQPAPTAVQTMRGSEAANQALPSPNLAADEFVNLGLDTLSTIPRSKVQRQTAPKPAAKPGQTKPTSRSSSGTGDRPQVAEPAFQTVAPTVVDPSQLPAAASAPRMTTVVVPARPPIAETPPPRSSKPAPVSPEPIRTAPPAIHSAPQPAPIQTTTIQTLPDVTLPQVAPASQAEAPQAETSQSRYYVVTDYSGDPSLEAARSAVPDAYVRNLPDEGAKVQLGAFSDQQKAEALRQQLQQQGIEAEVYQP